MATDGHLCRSMLERHVDDFLYLHGIGHDLEPDYPYDSEMNPAGLRADWSLSDGTLVEAAGMLSQPAYEAKLIRKRHLAEAYAVPLVVVTDGDLARLAQVFRAWLPTRM
jgi:hypothetical protein